MSSFWKWNPDKIKWKISRKIIVKMISPRNKVLRGMTGSLFFQAFQLNLKGNKKTRFGHTGLKSLPHVVLQSDVSLRYAPRRLEAVRLYWKPFAPFNIAHLSNCACNELASVCKRSRGVIGTSAMRWGFTMGIKQEARPVGSWNKKIYKLGARLVAVMRVISYAFATKIKQTRKDML